MNIGIGDNFFAYEIVKSANDIVAVTGLFVLAVVITQQKRRDSALGHALIGILMLMVGISFQIYGKALAFSAMGSGSVSGDFREAKTYTIVSAFLIAFSILEFFWEINEEKCFGKNRDTLRLICIIIFGTVMIVAAVFAKKALPNVLYCSYLILILLLSLISRSAGIAQFGKFRYLTMLGFPICTLIIDILSPMFRVHGIGMLFMYFLMYVSYHQRIEQELISKELELSKSKVQLLMEQISPHFIFNSLQSIAGISDKDPGEVRPAIELFSEYLRDNLESLTNDDLIPFNKEIEHTKAYVELAKMGGSRDFDVEFRLETADFMVPPLVLQPLVENAVLYGTGSNAKQHKIIIETAEYPDRVEVRVINDVGGTGDPIRRQSDHKSVGLKNVRTRIEAQCRGTLTLETADGMTTATMVLPKAW